MGVFPYVWVRGGNRHVVKYLQCESSISLLLDNQSDLLYVFLVVDKFSVFLGYLFSGPQPLITLLLFAALIILLKHKNIKALKYSLTNFIFIDVGPS